MDILKIKNSIYKSIINGELSVSVFNILRNEDGGVIAKECELWDFKETFDDSSDGYLKTLKSIISFHNSYGGYIIYGVSEEEKDSKFTITGVRRNIINQQTLRGKFDKYFSHRLDLTYMDFEVEDKIVGILHVPKRSIIAHSIAPVMDGATTKNKRILEKDAVYFRKADECKQVVAQKDFEFVVSERNYEFSDSANNERRKKIIEHNLPDRNYICPLFIGRFDIIQELWSWLSDEFQYAKVLAADGGKGKTSIAYEFCQLLITSGSTLFEQVIWLTAKNKQFKAVHDTYVQSPEIHYNDLETLLQQICLRTGTLPSEINDLSSQQLQRIARDNLAMYPSFIVIDDVDSNVIDEQRRIMEIARVISNSSSRILLTTRVNNIYSSDSSILVPGLSGDDYVELIDSLCTQLKLPKYNEKNIEKLHLASEGSPLFTESILRLCKLGMSIDTAIKDWSGKSGELVRIAALRKEVSELSLESIKILLTISYIGSCSRVELHQYTELESSEINSAIEELGGLFLIKGMAFIETEPRFETSSSISKLTLSICKDIFPNSDQFIIRIKDISEGLEANLLPHIPEVGAAIRQCNSLLKEKRYSEARKTVKNLLAKPKFKENSDLYFMFAKTEYEDPKSSGDTIRKSFSEAYIKGQSKPLFFEMWYQTEIKYGGKKSIYDVCEYALKHINANDMQWRERFAYSCFDLCSIADVFANKIKYLLQSYESASGVIKITKGFKREELIKLSKKIIDTLWDLTLRDERYDLAATAIINALDNGDIRSANYLRLIEISSALCKEKYEKYEYKSVKDDVGNCLQWSAKILRASQIERKELAIKVEKAHNDFIRLLS